MFKKFALLRIPNGRFIAYFKRFKEEMAAVPNLHATIAETVAALNAEAAELDKAYLEDPATQLSEKVQAADAARDSRVIGLHEYCSSCSRRKDAARAEAAKTLLASFEHFGGTGGLTRVDFDTETVNLTNFLSDWRTKPHLQGAVAAVGAGSWLDDIEADNNAFIAAQQERLRHVADNKLAFRIIEKRKIIRGLYNDVMDMLTGAAKLAKGGEPWITLAGRLNRINEEFTERQDIEEGRTEAAKAATAAPTV